MPPERKNRSHLPVIPRVVRGGRGTRDGFLSPVHTHTHSLINNNDDAKQKKKINII